MNTPKPKPCVVGNWKMQGNRQSVTALLDALMVGLKGLEPIDIAVCPPSLYIPLVAEKIKGSPIGLGAQNIYPANEGAYTGEISPTMLRDFGCQYVIIGHSERRQLLGESNAFIAKKFKAAYDAGLIPILCLGETLKEREAGKTFQVIEEQLSAVVLESSVACFKNALIAYEPVWAIGTGVSATPEMAEEVHAFIRKLVSKRDESVGTMLRILYGGSLKVDNAAALFACENVDGGLIGGASLVAKDFLTICQFAKGRC